MCLNLSKIYLEYCGFFLDTEYITNKTVLAAVDRRCILNDTAENRTDQLVVVQWNMSLIHLCRVVGQQRQLSLYQLTTAPAA